jgi:hypothetical protein
MYIIPLEFPLPVCTTPTTRPLIVDLLPLTRALSTVD